MLICGVGWLVAKGTASYRGVVILWYLACCAGDNAPGVDEDY